MFFGAFFILFISVLLEIVLPTILVHAALMFMVSFISLKLLPFRKSDKTSLIGFGFNNL